LDDTSGGSSLLSRGPDQARFHQTILGRLKEMQSSLGFNDLIACRSASRILERFLAGELKDPWDVPYIERVRKGAVLAREYPFFLRDNDQNWHGVIDLVLRERDGIKVVDFKTGIRPQPLPEFYLKQAKVYKSVIQQLMQNEKVEFEFWWLSPSVET
jgi:ATP-dependent exoDNAse (exonuclease V) beta subunit